MRFILKVKDFKTLIETTYQMQADMMKLIFKSKILEDDAKTINDYGVVEGSAIVVMIQKVIKLFLAHLLGQTNKTRRKEARGSKANSDSYCANWNGRYNICSYQSASCSTDCSIVASRFPACLGAACGNPSR
jgi:hypothetical protein